MGLGSETLSSTVVLCAPRPSDTSWSVVGDVWVSVASVVFSRSNSAPKIRGRESARTCCFVASSGKGALTVSSRFHRSFELVSAAGEQGCESVSQFIGCSQCAAVRSVASGGGGSRGGSPPRFFPAGHLRCSGEHSCFQHARVRHKNEPKT